MIERTPQLPPVIKAVPEDAYRPVWSVMVPSYNCISYVKEALESILVQDPGEEIMQIEVIDDCSSDGDVKSFVEEIGKGRIKYFRQPRNVGSLRNFETCINRARGTYVHILHGDDIIKRGFYDEIGLLFKEYPEAGAAFTDFSLVNRRSEEITIKDRVKLKRGIVQNFLFKIAERQLIQPPAIVVKRSVYEEVGSFYAVHFGEDWEMWARIASRFPMAYSPKRLACYRVGQSAGISYESFLNGQNIRDIKKVIDIIQTYLPSEHREEIKKKALSYYSMYSIKVANSLLEVDRKAALQQIKNAYLLHPDLKTTLWLIRFSLMYLVRFKELKKKYKIRIN